MIVTGKFLTNGRSLYTTRCRDYAQLSHCSWGLGEGLPMITWVRVGGFTPIEMLRGVNGLSKTPAGSGIMFWSEYRE